MWGMATLAIEVSSASMKVAMVTVMAMAQGLARGRHVSWNDAVAAAAMAAPFCVSLRWDFLVRSGTFGAWGSRRLVGRSIQIN
jgi:hypothetical protein